MSTQLDPIIHPAHRLKICAMLAAATTVEMSLVKDLVGLSPSALSKQVAALVDACYVTQTRAEHDSRYIWLSLNQDG
ncbi:transcriptional regulator [Jonesiaceae bacterium BS-20]|uniref:Transcriptional regulator n=1 Tax=Jonesiaceae bacterium BS-20 TaxID=3120821 RepID=A0AAU7DZK2_9MICO